jgi:archaea-specific DNA-binding protein
MAHLDNSIFIGTKPFMNYVTGVVMQFTTKNADEVIIKARGKFISRAVDVSEVSCKRFLKGKVRLKEIRIDSEEFSGEGGRQVRVSTIEILLSKNQFSAESADALRASSLRSTFL